VSIRVVDNLDEVVVQQDTKGDAAQLECRDLLSKLGFEPARDYHINEMREMKQMGFVIVKPAVHLQNIDFGMRRISGDRLIGAYDGDPNPQLIVTTNIAGYFCQYVHPTYNGERKEHMAGKMILIPTLDTKQVKIHIQPAVSYKRDDLEIAFQIKGKKS